MGHQIYSPIIAFIVTIILVHQLKPLATRLNLVDKPGGRKQHLGSVPLIGGISIFIGFIFALLTLHIPLQNYRAMIAAVGLLVVVGVLDDFSELSPRSRIFAQLLAALLMVSWGGVYLHSLGNIFNFGEINLGNWSIPITIIAVMSIINAVNMTDGLDGLAGGLVFIQLALMAFICFHASFINNFHMLVLILATLFGFLIFNFPFWPKKQASIFLGDAGSMLLGLLLVWFAVSLTQAPNKAVAPVTMLWIMALPLYDLFTSIIRRIVKRQSMFRADCGHFHHIFQIAGYKKATITYIMCALSLLLGIIGLLMNYNQVPQWIMFSAFLGLFLLYYLAVAHAWRFMKFVKLKWIRRKRLEKKINVS